jgi:acetyl esterase/lipase
MQIRRRIDMSLTEKGFCWFFKNIVTDMDNKRVAANPPVEGLVCHVDIPYIEDGDPFHLLDVYYPENFEEFADENGNLQTVFDIHGGGWVYGKKHINEYYCKSIAKRGFAVVNINYRLAPSANLRMQLQDVFSALRFVLDNAERFHLSTKSLNICGDSAGGHLALCTAGIAGDLSLASLVDEEGKSDVADTAKRLNINALGLSCPAADLSFFEKHIFGHGLIGLVQGSKKPSPLSIFNVPARYLKKETCPKIYITTNYADFVRSVGRKLNGFLDEQGIPHIFRFVGKKDATNKLQHVSDVISPDFPESKRVIDEMCDYFRK